MQKFAPQAAMAMAAWDPNRSVTIQSTGRSSAGERPCRPVVAE